MKYDTFLSHNSQDKPYVRALAAWLKKNGISVFLDENNLEPGDILTDTLGAAMDESKSAIICIGPHGEGPWHKEEVNSLLNRSIKRSRTTNEFRLIPVMLPRADLTKLQWFLETRLYIDLRNGINDSEADLVRITNAIHGKPSKSVSEEPQLNPYRGLESFEAGDAPFFFGRSKESRELAQKLKNSQFTAIIGPSGTGKSSLARAGLATDAALAVLPEFPSWNRIVARPGKDLLRSILTQLYIRLPNEERSTAVDAAIGRVVSGKVTFMPQDWASGLNTELQTFFGKSDSKLLFLIDQFEEVFTHRSNTAITDEERQADIEFTLEALARFRNLNVKRWNLVITMRSDFYQRCRASSLFWILLEKKHSKINLDELNEEGWREAIKGPAARAGAYLETGLVETMLKDIYRQQGSMPLLQLALQELWMHRDGACLTHAAYESIGGVTNALQQRAEHCLSLLEVENSNYFDIARNLFVRLTSPGEGVSDTRRRLESNELNWEDTEPSEVDHVLTTLSSPENRLIVTDEEALEVTHEVLIRNCPTIRGWIEEARQDIPIQRRLTHTAQRWVENDRDPTFLSPADPPRELKRWVQRTPLRLTSREREFWKASRVKLERQHREKRENERKIRESSKKAQKRAALASVIALFALVATGIALNALRKADEARFQALKSQSAAHDSLSKVFTRVIGHGGKTGSGVTSVEHETLWELASLTNENEPVRKKILTYWQSNDFLLPLHNQELGLHATVGTKLSRRCDLVMVEKVVEALESPNQLDLVHLKGLESSLATFAERLGKKKLTFFANRLVETLGNSQETDWDRLGVLTSSLENLIKTLDSKDLKSIGERLDGILGNPRETNLARLVTIGSLYAVLTERIDAHTSNFFKKEEGSWLARALDNTPQTNRNNLYRLSSSLSKLAKELNPTTLSLFSKILLNAIQNTPRDDEDRRDILISSVTSLLYKHETDTGILVAEQLLEGVDPSNPFASPFTSRNNKAIAEYLSKTTFKNRSLAKKIADKWLFKTKQSLREDNWSFSVFFEGLPNNYPELLEKLDTTAANTLAKRLVESLKDKEQTNQYYLEVLDTCMTALRRNIDQPTAEFLAEILVETLENEKETNFDRLVSLELSLKVLTADFDSDKAYPLTDRLAKALKKSLENHAETNVFRFEALSSSLAVLAEKSTKAESTSAILSNVTVGLFLKWSESKQPEQTDSLLIHLCRWAVFLPDRKSRQTVIGYALQQLQSKDIINVKYEGVEAVDPIRGKIVGKACFTLTTPQLTNLLKSPFCRGELQKLVLLALEEKTEEKFEGNMWNFVKHATDHSYPGIDLDGPVHRITLDEVIAALPVKTDK